MGHNIKHHLLLIILICCLTKVYPQSTVTTNQEVISRTFISKIINVLTDSLRIKEPLTIKAGTEPLSNWMAQILTDSCLSKNYLVYSSADSGIANKYSVLISDASVKIEYRSGGKKWLFFNKRVHRSFQGSYHLQISNPDGRIVLSRINSVHYQDIIPSGAEKEVENQGLAFTKGTKSVSSFIKRWLEPVLVTATTASVVFLFYTLRSER